MRFNTFQHDKFMSSELKAGTHIAWLTKKGDNEATEPLARITLRPYSTNSGPSEPQYTSYKFHIPAYSEFVKNSIDGIDDENYSVENHIAMNLEYAMEDADGADNTEHFHGAYVEKHPTLNRYVVDMKFNKPLTKTQLTRIHSGLSTEISNFHPAIFENPVSTTTPAKDSHTILVPGGKTYGQQSFAFRNTVKDWTNKHFKPQTGTQYNAHPGIYMDGDSTDIVG
jgi:hypothetical protein